MWPRPDWHLTPGSIFLNNVIFPSPTVECLNELHLQLYFLYFMSQMSPCREDSVHRAKGRQGRRQRGKLISARSPESVSFLAPDEGNRLWKKMFKKKEASLLASPLEQNKTKHLPPPLSKEKIKSRKESRTKLPSSLFL